MRSTWCLAILAAAVVLVGGFRLSECGASGKRGSRKPASKAARKAAPLPAPSPEEVDGYGHDAEKARDRALDNARQRIVGLLQTEMGDSDWQPPSELLDLEKLQNSPPKGWGVITEVEKPKPTTEVDGDKALRARYKVQLTPSYLQAVQTHARQERVGERHLLLVRVLGGMLAVLLVTTGYLRLEEMTRGYYTRLLRLAAFAVLALAGLALLVIA